MFKFLILVAVIPAMILAESIEVVPCWDGNSPTPLAVVVRADCSWNNRCYANQGYPFEFNLEWIAPATTTNLTYSIVGRQRYFDEFIYHEIASPVANACDSLIAGDCPVHAGQALIAFDKFIAPPKGSLFVLQLDVEVRIKDEHGNTSTCAVIPLNIH